MTAEDAAEIRRTLLALRGATGLPVAFGGVVTDRRQLHLSELSGTTTNSLLGLAVCTGRGLGGKALAMSRPLAVTDYSNAQTISHQYDRPVGAEGLRSILAVPVVVQRSVRAMLYGALRQALPLGDRIITQAVEAARELEQNLAVRDELRRRMEQAQKPAPSSGPGWEEVRSAHAELRVLAQELTDQGLRHRVHEVCAKLASASGSRTGEEPPSLSPRELDVLSCVAQGQTNAATADQLGLLPETVKAYLRSAMRKLDCHSRIAAVVAARRAGLLP
ncbi:helix-turn-helix transcriptional regulator [Kutzneria viridogrisea]|uniref:HTH luxR-type domain-containing protein n=2 Tax=Kutzneria TaxID=43356 RepID=W5W2M7_9PSEU|nr:LuxR C-terminal-related transcriptional regulator [Kutzneria albida]AHH94741.1 hypothetical protein KALB_1368 [Kutzneria albida DSM 43870]MBA8930410.1 DNA-binding CsgD family transcriptional regulator [Kutzneria viridogrisea]